MLSTTATTNTATGSGRVNPFDAARASAHTGSSPPDPISTSPAIASTSPRPSRPPGWGARPTRLGARPDGARAAVVGPDATASVPDGVIARLGATPAALAPPPTRRPRIGVCTVDTSAGVGDHAPVVGQAD